LGFLFLKRGSNFKIEPAGKKERSYKGKISREWRKINKKNVGGEKNRRSGKDGVGKKKTARTGVRPLRRKKRGGIPKVRGKGNPGITNQGKNLTTASGKKKRTGAQKEGGRAH